MRPVTHRPPRGVLAIRDANESAFAAILEQLLRGLPGAYAAAFVDEEGECVEYAGAVDPFHIKVAAAHFRVLLEQLAGTRALGAPRWFIVRGSRESSLAIRAAEQYALVVLFSRGGGFAKTPRALAAALRQFAEEGAMPHEGERWYPARFMIDTRGRPAAWLGDLETERLEIVGTIMGLARGERGYRLRLGGGAEVTAIREVSRVWYTDHPFKSVTRSERP